MPCTMYILIAFLYKLRIECLQVPLNDAGLPASHRDKLDGILQEPAGLGMSYSYAFSAIAKIRLYLTAVAWEPCATSSRLWAAGWEAGAVKSFTLPPASPTASSCWVASQLVMGGAA